MNAPGAALTPREEDYIRCILEAEGEGAAARVGEVSRRLDVSPASVVGMYRKLEGKQMILYERRRGARLTPDGRDSAERVSRRHGLALRLLLALGVSGETAAVDADRLEHLVSPLVAERLSTMLEPSGDLLRVEDGVSPIETPDVGIWPREASAG